MFLKEIEIRDFKNIEHLKLSFSDNLANQGIRQWTFLLGENGTGKSNLLKAIALVTAGSDALGELLGNPNDWIRYGQTSCTIKATLINTAKEERQITLTLEKGDELKSVMKRSYDSLDEIDQALNQANNNYFVVAYGANRVLANGARSNVSKDFYRSKRANTIATLFHRSAKLNSLTDWAIDLDYRKDQIGLQILEQTLDKLLPEVKFDSINKKDKQLLFTTPDGKIPLDDLSDGYQNMAAWLGDLLFRLTNLFEDYTQPLNSTGLLLIDELELHLHPLWQRNLIRLLKNTLPNFQIICSTHSPLTAQQAGYGELFFLKRIAGKGIALNQYVGNPRYMPVNELLLSNLFGLPTDESVEVQEKKARYRSLKNKQPLSQSEQTELGDLSDFLLTIPLSAQNSKDQKQLELIEKLMKQRK